MTAGIYYRTGDATSPHMDGTSRVIIHVCNDVGGWGAGFVLALSRRWSEPEKMYRAWYKTWTAYRRGFRFGLGNVQLVKVKEDVWVANMVAQRGLGGPQSLHYTALRFCLREVRRICQDLTHPTVHMPRIGCGLAGGKWKEVEKLVKEELVSKGITCVVYDLPREGS